MIDSVGLIEFKKIPKGVLALDKIVKNSDVQIIMARLICPGRYLIFFSGKLEDINNSINCVKDSFSKTEFKYKIVTNIREEILRKINRVIEFENDVKAIGIVETKDTVSVFKVSDFILKEFEIDLKSIKINIGTGGKGVVFFTGNIAALKGIEGAFFDEKWSKLILAYEMVQAPDAETIKHLA